MGGYNSGRTRAWRNWHTLRLRKPLDFVRQYVLNESGSSSRYFPHVRGDNHAAMYDPLQRLVIVIVIATVAAVFVGVVWFR